MTGAVARLYIGSNTAGVMHFAFEILGAQDPLDSRRFVGRQGDNGNAFDHG